MLSSYGISRKLSVSDPIQELRREKNIQLQELYKFATDREEAYWSDGIIKKPFKMTPRIFDTKYIDSSYTRITVETICKEDKFVTGDYIYFDDYYWLCLNSHSFHGMYCRGLFEKCNYMLRWQNTTTLKINERPAIIKNATKYGVGQDFGEVVEIPTSSRQIQIRYDEETILLDSPQRLFIDHNKNNPRPFVITQNDNTTLHFGNGIINIVCQADEYNKYTDNIEKWICDYIDPIRPIKHTEIKSKIIGRDDLRINDRKLYSVEFYNHRELISNKQIQFVWNIICDFKDDIIIESIDDKLYLRINNIDHIGKTFKLQVLIDNEINSEITISVIDMY